MLIKTSRRKFLLGAGAAPIALPLLPQLGYAAPTGPRPKNLIFFWVPDGVARNRDAMNAVVLERHRASVAILRNGQHTAYEREHGSNEHPNAPRTLLTGGQNAPDRKMGALSVPAGRSADQIVGSAVGTSALFPTYELGAYAPNNKDGVRFISFDAKGRARQPVYNPLRAFEDLLTGVGKPTSGAPSAGEAAAKRRLMMRASILDSVEPELKQVCQAAGAAGRDSLDAYLTSVRTVEKRIEQLLAGGGNGGGSTGAIPVPSVPAGHGQASFYENVRNYNAIGELQLRIAAAALAAGRTRVVTMHWGTTGPAVVPDWIPDRQLPGTTAHQLSHAGTNSIPSDKADRDKQGLMEWYEDRFAFLLDRLKEIQVGDHTLLDETVVLRIGEANGQGHTTNDLPLTLAGAPGTFAVGRDHDMKGRPHNDLLTAILQGFGIEAAGIGREDSNRGAFTDVLR